MKTWTQDMLPLTIIKDLGLLYPKDTSTKKIRYIEFQCPTCSNTFKAEPSKVRRELKTCCTDCARRNNASSKVNKTTGLKNCTKCNANKPPQDFYYNSKQFDKMDTRCKSCMDEIKADWVARNKNKVAAVSTNSRLVKRYGLTLKEYNILLEAQEFKCKICGNLASEGRSNTCKLSVDHCHSTNKIRGLLCQKCNTGLGLLGDNIESLTKALNYLKESI